ncbi:FkbM family methyltransferase [Priestia aryabhattai]|uniref:FkbM family methyltransferase n=1 Tax=Priestia TaxID=2800373 RepID=UPI001C8D7272|nr:FkbM family methyltransferase [Priestia aryabhattai]MBY0074698.1 FkbM family methyltransferase [Priestia aryabhattai]
MEKSILNLPFDQKSFTIFGSEQDISIFQPVVKANGYYDPFMMNFLKKIINPTSVCLDIGANIGLISLTLSHLANNGLVYSFEPSNTNFFYLSKTIAENRIQNIVSINLGLYDKNSNIKFMETGNGGGWSHVDEYSETLTPDEVVTCVRLDDWIESEGITNIDFIKMDIEGSEIKALNGAMNTLHKWKPDLIIEFNPVTISTFNPGVNPKELFTLLNSTYPNIYFIDRITNSLVKIVDYSHLSELISPTILGDLYCTFK